MSKNSSSSKTISVQEEKKTEFRVVFLEADITVNNVFFFADAIAALISNGQYKIKIDFREKYSFLCVQPLGMLKFYLKKIQEEKGKLFLIHLPSKMSVMLKISNLENHFV